MGLKIGFSSDTSLPTSIEPTVPLLVNDLWKMGDEGRVDELDASPLAFVSPSLADRFGRMGRRLNQPLVGDGLTSVSSVFFRRAVLNVGGAIIQKSRPTV